MSTSSFIDTIKQMPPMLVWREHRYEREFAHHTNSFRGVFNSFEEALASAPKTKAKGFNVDEFVGFFDNRRNQLFLYDYPVLFWLDRILCEKSRVFDIGGNTGIHYVAYRPYLRAWDQVQWEICEVPVVVEAGKKFAEREGYADHLSFTDNIWNAEGADVVLSSGTLQYIDKPSLQDLLASLKKAPDHLLLGKLPLYSGRSYVTLQNGGPHFVAQRVFNRKDFLGRLNELGYRVVDEWQDPSRSCHVPFHPECSVPVFTGLYLSH